MINPLLEEFDPARRPLLFLWNFGLLRLQETGRAQLRKSSYFGIGNLRPFC
jgi:hypothetical protein